MSTLRRGQLWKFDNRSTGEVRTYELESFEDPALVKGARGRLRNVDNDRYAEISCNWLRKGKYAEGLSEWRAV